MPNIKLSLKINRDFGVNARTQFTVSSWIWNKCQIHINDSRCFNWTQKIIPFYSQKKKIHFMPKVFSVQLIWVCIPNVLRLDTWSKTINSTVIYNVWVPQMAINELKADATHFDWTTTELLWTTTELLQFQKNKHHFTEVSISMLLSIKTWFNAWAQHILISVGFEVVLFPFGNFQPSDQCVCSAVDIDCISYVIVTFAPLVICHESVLLVTFSWLMHATPFTAMR